MSKPIALAADHGGVHYKTLIAAMLRGSGREVLDFGTDSTVATDYPDYAWRAAEAVSRGEADWGIVVCGSGIGVSIVANKAEGVRAANCLTPEMARLARAHNNANVLSLGAKFLSQEQAKEAVLLWLQTDFSGEERHARRIGKLN